MYLKSVLGGWLLLSAGMASAATLVVNSTRNDIAAGPEYTLTEALTDAKPGDSIHFNIPEDGPHFIKPPPGGFPILSTANLTIDGFTQPGSIKNSNSIRGANNAKLQIFLDSREGPGAVTPYSATGIPVLATGEEAAMLLVFNAQNLVIRGIGFLSRRGTESVDNPNVHCIAFVGECLNPKIQGCWLGLHPDGKSVFGGDNGINTSIIPGRVEGTDQEVLLQTVNLVVGTDGDGVEDRSEFNIIMGHQIDMLIGAVNTRISGNFVNFFPDAKSFYLNPNGAETIFESGNPDGLLMGTDGNGVADADEANVMSKSFNGYQRLFEFYRTGRNVVIAGNYIGVAPNGVLGLAPGNFLDLRGGTDVRVGSNMDGTSDDLESNWIYGTSGVFVKSSIAGGQVPSTVLIRRNRMVGNNAVFPFSEYHSAFYNLHLGDPNQYTPTLSSSTNLKDLRGTVPPAKDSSQTKIIDLYLADPEALTLYNSPQGKIYKASFVVDGAGDRDAAANAFDFDITSLNLPSNTQVDLVICAIYTRPGEKTLAGATTLPFSQVVSLGAVPPLAMLLPTREGTNVKLKWTGGRAPYYLEHKPILDAEWAPVPLDENAIEKIIPGVDAEGYFRVKSF